MNKEKILKVGVIFMITGMLVLVFGCSLALLLKSSWSVLYFYIIGAATFSIGATLRKIYYELKKRSE